MPPEKPPAEPPEDERTVCFCHNVPLSRLLTEIRSGADTLHEIQARTCASTGCGGCEWDVREVLEGELEKIKGGSGPP